MKRLPILKSFIDTTVKADEWKMKYNCVRKCKKKIRMRIGAEKHEKEEEKKTPKRQKRKKKKEEENQFFASFIMTPAERPV